MTRKGVTIVRAAEENLHDYPHANSRTGKQMYQREYINDKDTGMLIKKVLYPAGCMIPLHSHDCAHGCYVIKGTLKTDDGVLGPGDFIWWDQGVQMIHGGDEEDVELLFITNKPLTMNYLD
ncbi:MAG: hypothetical protein J6D18_03710 [Erysipelotrichaceae bacterium]|nr:hypothetical protein [Erysipelotrichaceae bacterium]